MPKIRRNKINEAVIAALISIELCETDLTSLHALNSRLHQDYRNRDNKPLQAAFSLIFGELHRRKNDAFQSLMTMGYFADPDTHENIKRQAYLQYLREGLGIMGYLEIFGLPPGRYYTEDEAQFRADLEASLGDEFIDQTKTQNMRVRSMAELRKELKARLGEPDDEDTDGDEE